MESLPSLKLILLIFSFLVNFACAQDVGTEDFNPFPFISFGENEETIVEAQPIEHSLENVSQSCQETYSLLEDQSMEFRSPNFPSSYPDNFTSVTCFNSPPNSKISMQCDEFILDCSQDYFGISTSTSQHGSSHAEEKNVCGTDLKSGRILDSNELQIFFRTNANNQRREGSEQHGFRFRCLINVVGSVENTTSVSDSPSSAKSRHLTKRQACDCGKQKAQNRIVGGTEAGRNEFPWRCYLQIGGRAFCGCSLISNKWVMTAAHCTQSSASGRATVVLGAHERGRGSTIMTVRGSRVINHPQYNSRLIQNDISLIELSREITPSGEISPVCLPWKMRSETFAGRTAVTSGWGRTTNGGSISSTLRKVDLSVVTNQACSRAYRNRVSADMICGNQSGKGTCQGDSGGSLDFKKDSRFYAIGITSWGDSRCRSYSVFSRVTHFLNWIETSTGESFCKV